MSIGKNIKNARKKAGLTQKELAEKMGSTQQNLAQYESGKRNPKLETLNKIAEALKIPVSLLTDSLDSYEKGEILKLDLIELIKNLNLEINDITSEQTLEDAVIQSAEKKRHYIRLYDQLTVFGQDKAIEQVELLTKIPEYQKKSPQEHTPILKAAHERTDIEVTDEMRKHDRDIMEDDTEWK